jgi:hypothetical protein
MNSRILGVEGVFVDSFVIFGDLKIIIYICKMICVEPGESCSCICALLNTVKQRGIGYRRLDWDDRGFTQKFL